MKKFAMVAAAAAMAFVSSAAMAATTYGDYEVFAIRNANGSGDAPTYSVDGAGNYTVNVSQAGQKVGIGTTSYNGEALSSIGSLSYGGDTSGWSALPYWNIWVTDGTNKASLAPNVIGGGAVNGQDLSTLAVAVTNNTAGNVNWLFAGGSLSIADGMTLMNGSAIVTFGQLVSGLTVFGNGDPAYGPTIGDSGAAKNGTGVILMFGNIQGNLNGPGSLSLNNVSIGAAAAAVPLPTAAMGSVGLLAMTGLRRRR